MTMSARTAQVRSALTAARRSAHVVAIRRKRIDAHPLRGVVVDVGTDHALLQRLSDSIHLDGYSVFRITDVTDVELRPRYQYFYQRALRLRREWPRLPLGIDLVSIRRVIASAGTKVALLTLHREAISPDTCSIGTVRQLTEKSITLRWLTPNAKWDGDSPRYRLADVTLLEFGGEYEDALARVVGARQPAFTE